MNLKCISNKSEKTLTKGKKYELVTQGTGWVKSEQNRIWGYYVVGDDEVQRWYPWYHFKYCK